MKKFIASRVVMAVSASATYALLVLVLVKYLPSLL